MPDLQDLEVGAANNPDGFGYAILTMRGNLLVRRSMDADQLLGRFAADRRKHRWGPALFHCRIGTSGTKTLQNCHPFQVGRDGRTVIAHNGVLFRPPEADRRQQDRSADRQPQVPA
jgi:glutamine amidotransferase